MSGAWTGLSKNVGDDAQNSGGPPWGNAIVLVGQPFGGGRTYGHQKGLDHRNCNCVSGVWTGPSTNGGDDILSSGESPWGNAVVLGGRGPWSLGGGRTFVNRKGQLHRNFICLGVV